MITLNISHPVLSAKFLWWCLDIEYWCFYLPLDSRFLRIIRSDIRLIVLLVKIDYSRIVILIKRTSIQKNKTTRQSFSIIIRLQFSIIGLTELFSMSCTRAERKTKTLTSACIYHLPRNFQKSLHLSMSDVCWYRDRWIFRRCLQITPHEIEKAIMQWGATSQNAKTDFVLVTWPVLRYG